MLQSLADQRGLTECLSYIGLILVDKKCGSFSHLCLCPVQFVSLLLFEFNVLNANDLYNTRANLSGIDDDRSGSIQFRKIANTVSRRVYYSEASISFASVCFDRAGGYR